MKRNFLLILLLQILLSSLAIAQPELWEVYTTSNRPYINVAIEKYESDSLYMKSMNMDFVLHQDSIQYIIQNRKSQFGVGFLFGAVAGGLFSNAMFRGSDNSWFHVDPTATTMLGAVSGGLVGGLLGASATKRTIEIGKLKPEEKKKVLKNLFD